MQWDETNLIQSSCVDSKQLMTIKFLKNVEDTFSYLQATTDGCDHFQNVRDSLASGGAQTRSSTNAADLVSSRLDNDESNVLGYC